MLSDFFRRNPNPGLTSTFAVLGKDALYLLYPSSFVCKCEEQNSGPRTWITREWSLCFTKSVCEVVPSLVRQPRSFYVRTVGQERMSLASSYREDFAFTFLGISVAEQELRTRFELPRVFLLLPRVSLYWKRQLCSLRKNSKHYWHLLGDHHSQVLWKSPLL